MYAACLCHFAPPRSSQWTNYRPTTRHLNPRGSCPPCTISTWPTRDSTICYPACLARNSCRRKSKIFHSDFSHNSDSSISILPHYMRVHIPHTHTLMQDHMAIHQEINFSEYNHFKSYNVPVSVEHLLWYVSWWQSFFLLCRSQTYRETKEQHWLNSWAGGSMAWQAHNPGKSQGNICSEEGRGGGPHHTSPTPNTCYSSAAL